MAAATYLTRVAGYWLMGHIPMTQRVRRMPRDAARRDHGGDRRSDRRQGRCPWRSSPWWSHCASMIVKRNEFIAAGLALAAASLARAYGLSLEYDRI